MPFKMKGFEPHNMYKTEKADTYEEHLSLKEDGYDHSPYKKKCGCWTAAGSRRQPGTQPCAKGSCYKPGKTKSYDTLDKRF